MWTFLQRFSSFPARLIAPHSTRGAHWLRPSVEDPDRSGQERLHAIEEPLSRVRSRGVRQPFPCARREPASIVDNDAGASFPRFSCPNIRMSSRDRKLSWFRKGSAVRMSPTPVAIVLQDLVARRRPAAPCWELVICSDLASEPTLRLSHCMDALHERCGLISDGHRACRRRSKRGEEGAARSQRCARTGKRTNLRNNRAVVGRQGSQLI